jgi:hypothetical protein
MHVRERFDLSDFLPMAMPPTPHPGDQSREFRWLVFNWIIRKALQYAVDLDPPPSPSFVKLYNWTFFLSPHPTAAIRFGVFPSTPPLFSLFSRGSGTLLPPFRFRPPHPRSSSSGLFTMQRTRDSLVHTHREKLNSDSLPLPTDLSFGNGRGDPNIQVATVWRFSTWLKKSWVI